MSSLFLTLCQAKLMLYLLFLTGNQFHEVEKMQYKPIEYVSGLGKVARGAVLTGLAGIILYTSGCGTFYGLAGDGEAACGAIRRTLQGAVDKQNEKRWTDAQKERQAQIDKAAELVIRHKSQ